MLTVGQILKKERLKQGYSLNDVEGAIKIRKKFLQAVEADDWKNFSSKIYIIGILKNYANFLGLSTTKVVAYFRRDYEKIEDIRFKKKLSEGYLTPQSKKFFFIFFSFIFFIFFLYFGIQLKNYLTPPQVKIISPKSNIIKSGVAVKIIGQTDKDAVITVAGERVFQDKEGRFDFNHPLNPGKNIVVIEVIGANGKKTIVKKEFFLKTKLKD